jgi:hypothetical protein
LKRILHIFTVFLFLSVTSCEFFNSRVSIPTSISGHEDAIALVIKSASNNSRNNESNSIILVMNEDGTLNDLKFMDELGNELEFPVNEVYNPVDDFLFVTRDQWDYNIKSSDEEKTLTSILLIQISTGLVYSLAPPITIEAMEIVRNSTNKDATYSGGSIYFGGMGYGSSDVSIEGFPKYLYSYGNSILYGVRSNISVRHVDKNNIFPNKEYPSIFADEIIEVDLITKKQKLVFRSIFTWEDTELPLLKEYYADAIGNKYYSLNYNDYLFHYKKNINDDLNIIETEPEIYTVLSDYHDSKVDTKYFYTDDGRTFFLHQGYIKEFLEDGS